MTVTLVMLRHGQCEGELKQRFVGWADTALTDIGIEQAGRAGRLLRERDYRFDRIYTSVLQRAEATAARIARELDAPAPEIHQSWRLNARHYGALEGRSKPAARVEFGGEQVYRWRRQAGSPPPPLETTDSRYPGCSERYRAIGPDAFLTTECYGDIRARALGYWREVLAPQVRAGRRLLLVAHGSTLRPLIEAFSSLDTESAERLKVPTAVPLVYEFDERARALSWFRLDGGTAVDPLFQPSVHRSLQARGLRYVVLCGARDAPQVPGDDPQRPALLVAQSDVPHVRAVLTDAHGAATYRVYGTLGLDGADYRKLPYLAPHLAEAVLADSRSPGDGPSVPSEAHSWLIQAYDQLYHGNGDQPLGDGATVNDPNELSSALEAEGWRPPLDLFGRMSWCNEWIRSYMAARSGESDPEPGLGVFLLRESGMERGGLQRLQEELERAGFEVLFSKILSREERARARSFMRIGRWGAGPWPESGGGPAAIVIVFDLEPLTPRPDERARFPWLSNGRTLVKEMIRRHYNADSPPSRHSNAVHATDNSAEAQEVIDLLAPELAQALPARMAQLQRAYRTEETVLRRLTRFARRAKVEVVVCEGREVVKKTFKPSKLRFCRREREAGEMLAHIPAVPRFYGATDNAVLLEYFPDARRFDRHDPGLLPLIESRAVVDALRAVYDAGYALLDARPENLLLTEGGVKLIDFEFLYRYDRRPPTFEDSYDMAGCPADFGGDQPKGGATSYARDWQPIIGLSLESLLHDPVWLQHCKRMWVIARRWLTELALWLALTDGARP